MHALFAAVVKDQRVQVAVSGVENIGHRKLVLAAEFINPGQHLGQGASGHHTVLQVIAGIKPAQG